MTPSFIYIHLHLLQPLQWLLKLYSSIPSHPGSHQVQPETGCIHYFDDRRSHFVTFIFGHIFATVGSHMCPQVFITEKKHKCLRLFDFFSIVCSLQFLLVLRRKIEQANAKQTKGAEMQKFCPFQPWDGFFALLSWNVARQPLQIN